MNLHDQETFRRGKEEGILEGRADGERQGIQQGERQKAIVTAKNFLAYGDSVEKVADCTGLSVAEVQQLKEN